jgi:hypothetical protein
MYVGPSYYKQEDVLEEEKQSLLASKAVVTSFEDCEHPEDMREEATGICMGCGIFVGKVFSIISVGALPGVHHHAFASNVVSSAEARRKKAAETKSLTIDLLEGVCDGIGEFSQTRGEAVKLPSDKARYSLFHDLTSSVPSFGIIKPAVIFPPPVRAMVNGTSLSPEARASLYLMAFKSVTKDLVEGPIPISDGSVMPAGLLISGAYRYCSALECISFAPDVPKDEQITMAKVVEKDIVEEVERVFVKNISYLFKQRRRIHISLFVALMVAHLRKVHAFDGAEQSAILRDNPGRCTPCAGEECLNLLYRTGASQNTPKSSMRSAPRGRPRSGTSKRSCMFAIAHRAGIPQNCLSRLQRVIFLIATNQSPDAGGSESEEES